MLNLGYLTAGSCFLFFIWQLQIQYQPQPQVVVSGQPQGAVVANTPATQQQWGEKQNHERKLLTRSCLI